MSNFNRVKPCRYGSMIYNINDVYVGKSLDLYGEYSEAEVELFRQLIAEGDIVVDVGAYIGAHTLFFAGAVGARGAVVAIEPQRGAFQALCGNMAINSVANAICLQAAAAAEAGFVNVPVVDQTKPNNAAWLSLAQAGAPQGDRIQKITIDSLGLPRCKLLKIDAPGMPREVLAGSLATIQRARPCLYVENSHKDQAQDLIRDIDALGYDIYPHNTRMFNPNNFAKNPQNVFRGLTSAGLFCVHKTVKVNMNGIAKLDVRAQAAAQ
jgi:FkbM family methyltransferase